MKTESENEPRYLSRETRRYLRLCRTLNRIITRVNTLHDHQEQMREVSVLEAEQLAIVINILREYGGVAVAKRFNMYKKDQK